MHDDAGFSLRGSSITIVVSVVKTKGHTGMDYLTHVMIAYFFVEFNGFPL